MLIAQVRIYQGTTTGTPVYFCERSELDVIPKPGDLMRFQFADPSVATDGTVEVVGWTGVFNPFIDILWTGSAAGLQATAQKFQWQAVAATGSGSGTAASSSSSSPKVP
jgi:hypothetical protein